MPKTRTDTTVMKMIITIARFSIKGVGTLSLSGPKPGDSVVILGSAGSWTIFGSSVVIGMFSEVVDGVLGRVLDVVFVVVGDFVVVGLVVGIFVVGSEVVTFVDIVVGLEVLIGVESVTI